MSYPDIDELQAGINQNLIQSMNNKGKEGNKNLGFLQLLMVRSRGAIEF